MKKFYSSTICLIITFAALGSNLFNNNIISFAQPAEISSDSNDSNLENQIPQQDPSLSYLENPALYNCIILPFTTIEYPKLLPPISDLIDPSLLDEYTPFPIYEYNIPSQYFDKLIPLPNSIISSIEDYNELIKTNEINKLSATSVLDYDPVILDKDFISLIDRENDVIDYQSIKEILDQLHPQLSQDPNLDETSSTN